MALSLLPRIQWHFEQSCSMTAENRTNIKTSVISTNSLIFPEASQNWSRTLSSLKRSTLSICNRLASIHEDSLFVQRVADIYDLPLIANERCGSWYIPAGRKAGSAYFKSTDGHQGQWSFSTRRLNLQLLDVIGRNSGYGWSSSSGRLERLIDTGR